MPQTYVKHLEKQIRELQPFAALPLRMYFRSRVKKEK
jgi:predicted GTPase